MNGAGVVETTWGGGRQSRGLGEERPDVTVSSARAPGSVPARKVSWVTQAGRSVLDQSLVIITKCLFPASLSVWQKDGRVIETRFLDLKAAVFKPFRLTAPVN